MGAGPHRSASSCFHAFVKKKITARPPAQSRPLPQTRPRKASAYPFSFSSPTSRVKPPLTAPRLASSARSRPDAPSLTRHIAAGRLIPTARLRSPAPQLACAASPESPGGFPYRSRHPACPSAPPRANHGPTVIREEGKADGDHARAGEHRRGRCWSSMRWVAQPRDIAGIDAASPPRFGPPSCREPRQRAAPTLLHSGGAAPLESHGLLAMDPRRPFLSSATKQRPLTFMTTFTHLVSSLL
jgi:hypothetical protein